ncbi:MAG TPA: cell envelope integrity protein TolA [bacterium]
MRKSLLAVLLGTALVVAAAIPAARAEVDFGFFFSSLSPYGAWAEREGFGWVWTPAGMPIGWRPYTTGYWAYTDDGMMWIAEEPWGDIPFHYGRWAYDQDIGWFWVPDTVWAPAWVAWRVGGGFVGWAPLPPPIGFDIRAGFAFGGFGFEDIDAFFWNFVPQRSCFDHDLWRSFVARPRVTGVFRATKIVRNRFDMDHGRVRDRTFSDDTFRRWGGRPEKLRVRDENAEFEGRRHEVRGNELRIYRPTVQRRFPAPPQNRPPEERAGAPRGYQNEREELIKRQVQERELLQQLHQRELEQEKQPKAQAPLRYRQQLERNQMGDEHNRQIRQLERRYPDKERFPY